MNLTGTFTNKGLALTAKLSTGTSLEITGVVAGGAETPTTATALALPKQELAVNTPTRSGNTATIPATLTAAQASEDYTLMELGIYARDPEEGVILYKVYRLSQPVNIVAGSRMVLRFYLEETVSQDLGITVACSPAGLVVEEEFAPVRNLAMAKSTCYHYEHLEASKLQAFLEKIPRFLTEYLYIYVEGELTEPLLLEGFHGNGALVLIQEENAEACVFKKQLMISYCTAHISLVGLTFQKEAGANSICVKIVHGHDVCFQSCVFSGNGSGTGIEASMASMIYLNNCAFSGFNTVVLSTECSVMVVSNNEEEFHDNICGAHVWHGGIILLGGNTPKLLGGSYNSKSGGIIANTDGTLL